MSPDNSIPELKQVLGSLIFGARHPVSVAEMRQNLTEVAESYGRHTSAFASAKPSDIRNALTELQADVAKSGVGFHLNEIAGSYAFQSDDSSGPWLRHFLEADKPHRLSRPALETLAIIAYRQPITRAEIEDVRGVNVDHIIRVLLEVQLVKIVGRSKLPGRPMLHGTTKKFLEHFGLADVKHLPGIEELARRELSQSRQQQEPDVAQEDEGGSEATAAEQEEKTEDTDDSTASGTDNGSAETQESD
jgi:segregation and condensation protein B